MKTTLIAEIAQAHDGSLGQAHAYIDALHQSGVSIIKFQTHIAHAESSAFEKFRTPFSYVDKTRYDYWKRMEFSKEQWSELKAHCESLGFEFMSSPFSVEAVALLESLGVKKYKIGSGELTDFLVIDTIAQTQKPVIISSGMSDWNELDKAVSRVKKHHNQISLLQCTTAYPTKPSEIELPVMLDMKNRYNLPVGLSDHSGSIYPSLAAVAMGAEIIEFHVCFDKRQFGPDSKASLSIDEVYELAKATTIIEECKNIQHNKNDVSAFAEMKINFGKSIAVNRDLPTGHIIRMSDLESKKPAGMGISSTDYEKLIGKKLSQSLGAFDFINWNDLQNE